jgi:hypothetical protein
MEHVAVAILAQPQRILRGPASGNVTRRLDDADEVACPVALDGPMHVEDPFLARPGGARQLARPAALRQKLCLQRIDRRLMRRAEQSVDVPAQCVGAAHAVERLGSLVPRQDRAANVAGDDALLHQV